MNEATNHNVRQQGTPAAWQTRALCGVVAVEAIVMLTVTGILGVDIVTQPSLSRPSAIALGVLALIADVLLVALTIGTFRERRWIRGLTAVWQALQVPAAVTLIRGDLASPLGWLLAALSLTGLLLVFNPTVISRLRD